MSSIGFHTTKLQHDNIQYEKHKSSGHPKEITVTVVIQTFFASDSKLLCRQTKCFLVCESNYCADAKSFFLPLHHDFATWLKLHFYFYKFNHFDTNVQNQFVTHSEISYNVNRYTY